jgi:hypothetical protein
MQKVITVFITNKGFEHATYQKPETSYENPELNNYLDQGYKITQTISHEMGGSLKQVAITFILERTNA